MHRLITALIVISVLFVVVTEGLDKSVYSQTTKETDPVQRVEDLEEEIAEYEKMIELLNEDIEYRLQRIAELDVDITHIEQQLAEAELELEQAEERLAENTEQFKARVRSVYMKEGSSYLEILLSSASFGDLITRFVYVTKIMDRDAQLIATMREEQEKVEQYKAMMAEQRELASDRSFQLAAERRNLEQQRESLEALLATSYEDLEEALGQVPQAEQIPAYGIVFDNHPNARPQHGLAQASTVYEFEVEGRMTRYLALFGDFPSKVGPLRSARQHSIMLALENDVHFIHTSGTADNLERMRNWGVSNTNALAHAAFYRDSARRAPHNLYVNLATLNRAESSGSILRPGHISRQGSVGESVSMQYSSNPLYRVSYQYDAAEGAYKRFINGTEHVDATGASIWARNVFIQYTDHPLDDRNRTSPAMVGEGVLDYYVFGQHFRGTWQKSSPAAPTRFYYADGQEIERIYGPTWIQIARPQSIQ